MSDIVNVGIQDFAMQIATATDEAAAAWTDGAKYIVIGSDTMFKAASLTMPQDDLGITGYYIRTAGKSIFLQAPLVHGYQHAAIALLRQLVGYEMYWSNVVRYHTAQKTITLPDITVIEKPDIEIRASGNNLQDGATAYAMGLDQRGNHHFGVGGQNYHNFLEVLALTPENPDNNDVDHPWLSKNLADHPTHRQPCYTARGDEAELTRMIEQTAAVIIAEMEKEVNQNATMFTLGNEDAWYQCTCKACLDEKDKYGTESGAAIKFFNRVSRIIQAHLQEQADQNGTAKRKFTLISFAYMWTEKPPVKNVNGKWEAIDSDVICDPEVGIMYAPIKADYRHSFLGGRNEMYRDYTSGWGAICQNLYMWTYSTNFNHYLYANGFWNTQVMTENYRYFKNNNTKWVYNQGAFYGMSTHFTNLTEYLDSKLGFNVNADVEELTNNFFDNYFGPASKTMRAMYDAIDTYHEYLWETYPEIYTGWCYDTIPDVKLWSFGALNSFLNYTEKAYKDIEPLKVTDPELYEVFAYNIRRESIFPRYALCDLHSGKYSKEEFRKMAASLKEDCNNLRINNGSGTNLAEKWAKWGV